MQRETLGAGVAHLHQREKRLDGGEGSENINVEDALELGQLSASCDHS
jgi:hypothetical protein